MSAIAAESLHTSLQNFSLEHHKTSVSVAQGPGFENHETSSKATLEQLDSDVSWPLPYHWEQYLDLKTGEVYYINWRTGVKGKEDPRNGNFYSDIEKEDNDDYDGSYSSSYKLVEGSSSSSESSSAVSSSRIQNKSEKDEVINVLVVAGCKRCLMYLMVAKHVEECPKCNAQLLHFERPIA